ncbi:MAG: hypothetical protein ACT4OV_02030 [Microthrixaceae bacterium]
MAEVTVFVDDAVRGTLPSVCVKDGVATADQLAVRDELFRDGDRAGLGVAWLLLLLGPLGWIGLLLMLISRGQRGEVLTVQVPMTEAAYQRLRAARRLGRNALVVGVVSGGVAVMAAGSALGNADAIASRTFALLAGLTLVGAIVARFVADRRERNATIGVDLDASRRWVTLSRVHPAFAAACQAHHQRQVERT